MPVSPLSHLRQHAPSCTPAQFLAANPGSWVQYYDDTPARDPAKALSVRSFDPLTAERKQREGCAVGFSVQPFGERRTKEGLLCFRTLGVDVDLVPAAEREALSTEEIDRRKEDYLRHVLIPFRLSPHWVTETGGGFHLLFRIQPQREPKSVRDAVLVNRRLVQALKGDPNAVLLTQVLRVPGTLQFKVPTRPFLCRLRVDAAAAIPPYSLAVVRSALDRWEGPSGTATGPSHPSPRSDGPGRAAQWREGLRGVAEGGRNVTAASLAGKILGRVPEELWEVAAWGGLKEWNSRNDVPLAERELRAVFESIARREYRRRAAPGPGSSPPAC